MRSGILIMIVLISNCIKSQEVKLKLYFEDSLGNKDTIEYVRNATATTSIDVTLGEADISDVPLRLGLDVRFSTRNYNPNYEGQGDYDSETWNKYQTKKIVLNSNCVFYNCLCNIDIYTEYWPVKLNYNYITNHSPSKMIVTNWDSPGGWFDVSSGCGWDVFVLETGSEHILDSVPGNCNYYVNDENGAKKVYYYFLGNYLIGAKTEVVNPVTVQSDIFNGVYTVSSAFHRPLEICIYTIKGELIQKLLINQNDQQIHINEKGIYVLKIMENDLLFTKKLIRL